jgi:hypothetical protein
MCTKYDEDGICAATPWADFKFKFSFSCDFVNDNISMHFKPMRTSVTIISPVNMAFREY